MSDTPPIIIKRKAAHAGHHGGAWKVAYADFVTALMSLFIVLWLMNTSKPVQVAVAGYFKDPTGKSKQAGAGGTAKGAGANQMGSGQNFVLTKDNVAQLRERLEKSIREVHDFEKLKSHIEITVTSEGLRIELLESATGTFFDLGSPEPNDAGKELLGKLAHELGQMPNEVSIEGHTDSAPFARGGDYGNWELSADRANSARRLMQRRGLTEKQVSQVRGYADQKLRKANDPLDPSNRRISVIVHFVPEEDSK
jgi:chemotaxis protein MotB